MPTYEYKCQKCNKSFEKFQSVTEAPLKKCIFCGGEVKRIFHPVGVIFKGSGFYTTDNREARGERPADAKALADNREVSKKARAKKDTQPKSKETAACDNCPSTANCN